MLLYQIVAHNVKQYGPNTVITFPSDGLIGVVGKNGAGKSSLLEIISWVLYNKIKDTKNEDIMNKQAHAKEDCYAEVYFRLNDVDYIARRNLKKTNDCFIRTANGEPFAQGNSNVTEFVSQNLFKMDFDAFISCYYAEQDDFDNLVKLTPAKRVQTVSKLLKIDAIDDAIKICRENLNTLTKDIDALRKVMHDEESLKNQKNYFLSEKTRINQSLTKVSEELNRLTEEYKELLLNKSTLDGDYMRFNDLKNHINNLTNQINTLVYRSLTPSKSELEQLSAKKLRYDQIAPYKEVYPSLNEKKEQMNNDRLKHQQKTMYITEINRLNEQIDWVTKQINEKKNALSQFANLDETLNDLTNELTKIREEGEKERSVIDKLSYEKQTAENDLTKLLQTKQKFDTLGADAPCPSCERPLGDYFDNKTQTLSEEIQSLQELITSIVEKGVAQKTVLESLASTYRETEAKINEIRNRINERNKIQNDIQHTENNVTTLNKNLSQYQEQLSSLGDFNFDENEFNALIDKVNKARTVYDEIISIENVITKIPNLEATIEEVAAEIANLTVQVEQYNKELTDLNFSEEKYAHIINLANNINQSIESYKNEQSNILIQLSKIDKDIDFIEQKINDNARFVAEISEKNKLASLESIQEKAFKQYKIDILTKIAPTLSDIMSNYIDIMTNGKYNQVELDKDYNIFIYREGKKHPLSFYSGGEKKLAALCQRLAISGLLVSQNGQVQFDMIAMDEVFGSMDNERQDNIIEMLRNLNEKFSQILIVTHSENVKESFDHLLELYQDSDGYSKFKYLTDTDLSDTEEILESYVLE